MSELAIPTSSYSIIIRIQFTKTSKVLSDVLAVISDLKGQVGAIDITKVEKDSITRDITVEAIGQSHVDQILEHLRAMPGVAIRHVSDRVFLLHLGGKIEVKSKIKIGHRDELSMAYTPGVARVCQAIHEQPEKAFNLTIKNNCVAVITDGTAVLGLGDMGPLAALPVMEGKAMLFKEFANVDAFPICLATRDIDEIVRTVELISPSFGAINLEDISAPRCFEIEERLQQCLNIPVFHDDQHGTAAVMTAGLLNAIKLTGKSLSEIKVVFNGVGAAGTACTKMLLQIGVQHIVGCDRKGALVTSRNDLDKAKREYASITNPEHETGDIHEVIHGADVFVGLSAPNILTVEDLKKMRSSPIVFAMANPIPEIMPEVAQDHVAVMATGRSDYPNQINNLLAFPGIFRGTLDCQASQINDEMKLAAAYAIANIIPENELTADYIVPSVFNARVVTDVAQAVKDAAHKTGVARR